MKNIERAKNILSMDDNVEFAYLFGSAATGKAGPLSDIDIAVYLADAGFSHGYRLDILGRLARALGTENLDVLMLNEAPTVMRFEVIRNGVILKENAATRVPFEALVLQEYLDTLHLREVQRGYMRRQFAKGEYFGEA